MANVKPIKRDPFFRGDTPAFIYQFKQPYAGYNWNAVTLDCSFTSVKAPNDNQGAAAVRLNQSLVVDATNIATYTFQLTHAESLTLTPGATYIDQCQLKENGNTFFTTPITGQTTIAQDYII